MSTTKSTIADKSKHTEQVLQHILQELLNHEINGQTDHKNTKVIRELIEKYHTNDCFIAFCGHFSAGKSSLINTLCGYKLLPSSPIPASANVVSIKYGKAGATVKHRSGEEQSAALEELEQYCLNGEQIETVELHYPVPFLQDPSFVLLDTPGVDSTDENHLKSTASALHMADVVFYVMDYNHVLSEINMKFAKRLAATGKPVYLLVNQIDKHREQEIPFSHYRHTIEQGFLDWGIKPAGFLYLSLKQLQHPHSELEKLQWLLDSFGDKHESLWRAGISNAVFQAIKDHRKWMELQHQEQKIQLQHAIAPAEQSEVTKKLKQLETAQKKIEHRLEAAQQEKRKELQSIIENANITPAMLRELAYEFLQSEKQGFRVGLMFAQKKTETEKVRRQVAFIERLDKQIEAHLHWHIENLISQSRADDFKLTQFQADLTWIRNQIHSGAVLNDAYTLQYCNQLAAEIKAFYRKKGNEWLEQEAAATVEEAKREQKSLQQQVAGLQTQFKAIQQLKQLETMEQEQTAALHEIAAGAKWDQAQEDILPNLALAPVGNRSSAAVIEAQQLDLSISDAVSKANARTDIYKGSVKDRLEQAVNRLHSVHELIQPLPGMGSIAKELQRKKERMEQQTFTVALFGAFSAGKSSFANALLGETVLPVSPNPTTAAINRILPTDQLHSHKTATVQLKSEAQLVEEVSYSLDILGLRYQSLEKAIVAIQQLKAEQIKGKGRPHYTFLKAFATGWGQMKNSLGEQQMVTYEEYRDYAAKESLSCFVDWIDLYYASPLTDQGVILVDTPGADSVNARHTGVAFNFIKNADAILFVTYYNHAFSRADKDFLLQLGRVKESFELDKMFFIVNAADLASSHDEVSQVLAHVKNNLLQYEIRQPQLFPVSSLQSLKGKQNQSEDYARSGMMHFEEAFMSFISGDLIDLSLQSAEHDLHRADALLQHLISSLQASRQEMDKRQTELEHIYTQLRQVLKEEAGELDSSGLVRDIQERMYHVGQRIYFRLGEWYNASFHPSLLQEDSGDIKSALLLAWKDFISSIEYNASQEVWSVSLKVENTVNQLLHKSFEQTTAWIQQKLPDCSFPSYEKVQLKAPGISEQLPFVTMDDKWLLKQFKSPKSFFEGPGKQQLREQLEKIVMEPLNQYLQQQTVVIEESSGDDLEILHRNQAEALIENVEEYVVAEKQLLNLGDEQQTLKQAQVDMKRFIQNN